MNTVLNARIFGRVLVLLSAMVSVPTLAQGTPSAQYSLTINGLAPDPIPLMNYSLSEFRAPGRPAQFDNLVAFAVMSSASPKLMLACANGQIFSSAVIAGQRLDGPQYQFVTITLSNVSITSYQPRSNGSDLPTESISLSFTRIRMEYVPLNPDGTPGDPIVTTVDVSGVGGA